MTDDLLLQDLHLIASAQCAGNTVAGTGAASDPQGVIDIHSTGDGTGRLRRLFFLSFRCLIIRVIKADPAAVELAPDVASVGRGLGDGNLIPVIKLSGCLIIGSGAFADIQTIGTHCNLGSFRALILAGGLTLSIDPVGIKSDILRGCIQELDLGTADPLGIPAHKLIAFICRNRIDLCRQLCVIALDVGLGHAAVGIIKDVCVIVGHVFGIDPVEIQIRFTQATAHQRQQDLTARVAPTGKEVNDHIFLRAAHKGIPQIVLLLVKPAGAAVIGEEDQCVELVLAQSKTVFVDQLCVQSLFILIQTVIEQNFRFRLGNAVGKIIVEHFRRAGGTVADCILGVVPIRLETKAFPLLQQFHTVLAGCHMGFGSRLRVYGNSTGCPSGHKNHNRQKKTDKSFLHAYFSLQDHFPAIIAEPFRKCNPYFNFYYIL